MQSEMLKERHATIDVILPPPRRQDTSPSTVPASTYTIVLSFSQGQTNPADPEKKRKKKEKESAASAPDPPPLHQRGKTAPVIDLPSIPKSKKGWTGTSGPRSSPGARRPTFIMVQGCRTPGEKEGE